MRFGILVLAMGCGDPCEEGYGKTAGGECVPLATAPSVDQGDADADADADADTDADTDTPPPADSDGDGLDDDVEVGLGTDPHNPDTDGDGLQDGFEVETWESDPLDRDTDGDGLEDGAEVFDGTSPVSDDTDADGLLDPEEIDLGTDPTVADTDLDGLDDGVERADTMTDPLDADSDDDGLLDGDEVSLGTDPWDLDTDGDTLTDGDEVTIGTDPLVTDSDGGGFEDPIEVSHGTDPLDPLDDYAWCAYAEDSLPLLVPDLTTTFAPRSLAFEVQLNYDAAGLQDVWDDLDNDLVIDTDEALAAYLNVALAGPEGDFRCSAWFDIVGGTPIPAPTWSSYGLLYQGWSIEISGTSDCPRLDPAVYGTDDVAQWIASLPVAIALGDPWLDLSALDPAEAALYYGVHITFDDQASYPLGSTWVYETECHGLSSSAGDYVLLENVGVAPAAGGVFSEAVYTAAVELLTGVDCGLPQADVSVVGWAPTPGPTPIVPAYMALGVEGVPGEELRDHWFDGDGDGVREAVASQVIAELYDSVGTYQCSAWFDAGAAVQVDPALWSAQDALGAPSGPIWDGWELTLTNGASDCPPISGAVFGTQNIVQYLDGTVLGIGLGEMVELATHGNGFIPDWTTLEPNLFSVYYSFDGVVASEIAFGTLYDLDDCDDLDPALEVLDGPAVLESGYHGLVSSTPYWWFTL